MYLHPIDLGIIAAYIALTDNGAVAASGVYFYRMQVAGAQKTRSMVVVR